VTSQLEDPISDENANAAELDKHREKWVHIEKAHERTQKASSQQRYKTEHGVNESGSECNEKTCPLSLSQAATNYTERNRTDGR